MEIFILRGLPGSGKTTWIENRFRGINRENVIVCSADDYHTCPKGTYIYVAANAGKAHGACLLKYAKTLHAAHGNPTYSAANLIVDNTNTTIAELAPYVRLAEAYEQPYAVLTFLCSPEKSIGRNIHKVPGATILAMHANLCTEKVPAQWKHDVLFEEKA